MGRHKKKYRKRRKVLKHNPLCDGTGKIIYRDWKHARYWADIEKALHKRNMRIYHCPFCGKFHLTKVWSKTRREAYKRR